MITIPPDENRHKKAIGYLRISSAMQINNESEATQTQKIQAYADSNEIEIIKWYYDEAQSGKNADRKELQKLIQFALAYRDQIDHVIVYKMSRASRDARTYYTEIVSKLYTRGITFRSATETFDDSPGGQFMELLHVGMAQFDNGIKREYTLDNMRSLAKQGYYQHPPIVGYDVCKVKNPGGKDRPSLKQNAMAPKVRMVLERFSVGDMNRAELTRYAAEVGLRSRYGKKMSEDSINRVLTNPVYAGCIRDSFTNFERLDNGKHRGIISIEMYERNQFILNAKNSRKYEVHLKKNQAYVLKGILLCGGCNHRLYASAPKTGNGGHSPRYHCGKGCKLPSIAAETVHTEFKDMLKRIKPTSGTLKLYKEVLIREANNQLGRINTEVEKLRDDLDDVSKLRVEAVEKYTRGDLTKEEKNELVDALEVRKFETTDKLKEMEEVQSLRENEIEYAITFMEQVDKQWSDAGFDLQQRFQNMIFPQGVVYDSQNHRFGTSQISVLYRSISVILYGFPPVASSKFKRCLSTIFEALIFDVSFYCFLIDADS